STNALYAGVRKGSGNECSATLRMTPTWRMVWLIAPLFAPIPAPLAHKKSGEQALGRSRGGFSCKIHITVDGLGNPLRLRLTGGHCHDITQAEALVEGLEFEHLLGDRGYASAD